MQTQRPDSSASVPHRSWFHVAAIALLVFGPAIIALRKCSSPVPAKKVRVIDTNTPPVSAELKLRPVQPQSLAELLALPPGQLEHVDLAVLNLLCATGLRGAEHLNVQQDLDTLDAFSKHVATETLRNFHRFAKNPDEYGGSVASYRMMMLTTVLQQDFQAHYSPKRARPQLHGEWEPSDAFFADSREVLLHGLLGGDRAGTCSSLPVLYVAVAQRLGYPVSLAAAKGHLYVRYEDDDEHLNIEATSVGYNSYPDDHYRKWPYPMSDAEVREYGLLRPKTKAEMLGAFLSIRAQTLTSARRFDEAAEAWAQSARYLPANPTLARLVVKARSRAANEKAADRWDELLDEVQRLRVPSKPDYSELRDQHLRLLSFMNQSTNLTALEQAVGDFKKELDAAWQREALAADSRFISGTNGSLVGPVEHNFPQLLSQPRVAIAAAPEMLETARAALEAQPERIRIRAERLPLEYRNGLPPEVLERLHGLKNEDQIVAEIHAYHVNELNRANRQALGFRSRPAPLPRDIQPDWLPPEYRDNLPDELRNQLRTATSKAATDFAVRQYRNNQQARQSGEALKREIGVSNENTRRLTTPPVVVEIVPITEGKP